MTVRGTCLCGDVAFEADAPFEFMGHCHCSMCRKHHGAAFSSALACTRAGSAGCAALKAFAATSPRPGDPARSAVGAAPRCRRGRRDRVHRAGPPGRRPRYAPAGAHLRRLEGAMARDRGFPAALRRLSTRHGRSGSFERRSEPVAGKVRGAASAAGSPTRSGVPLRSDRELPLLALSEGPRCGARFEPLRRAPELPLAAGRAAGRSYKVPEAERFTQAFCRTCGAKVPYVNAARGARRARRLTGRRPRGARGAAHLRRLEGALVRDRGRPPQHEAYPPGRTRRRRAARGTRAPGAEA